MQRIIASILLVLLSVTFVSVAAAPAKKKRKVSYREEFYYDDQEMFLCAVSNRTTRQVFYGQSQKKKYAVMYARASCQMQSYKGQCFVRAECNWEWVKVRKRRYIRVRA